MVVLGAFQWVSIVTMNNVKLEGTDSQSGHVYPAVTIQLAAACTVFERIPSISSVRFRKM